MGQLTLEKEVKLSCFHCGDDCPENHLTQQNKHFCCQGCQVIYNLLSDNGMADYYAFTETPGESQKNKKTKTYEFLDDENVVNRLLEFSEGNICKISLNLPQIHCSSCIWLLENLQKLNEGVIQSRINFLQKKATITFQKDKVSLRTLIELLTKIGYEPELNLHKLTEKKGVAIDRKIYYKLGLAGFVFGNIMLLSFPEYFGFAEEDFRHYLGYINILLSIPVVLYSGMDYLRSAFWTIKLKKINIDIPIAVGIITLFTRSTYEILSGTGEGYLDSLAGFIFLLLVGRWFQNYTFQSISFDHNYRSYFPISATILKNNTWETVTLDALNPNDLMLIKNEEIIPTDGIIMAGTGRIDYSFVTGEAILNKKEIGEKIFAGGKHVGANIQVKAINKVDQSYLTKLWDDEGFVLNKEANTQMLIHSIGKWFTIIIMFIAFCTLGFWLYYDPSLAFNSFTAVLIVACPCALALAIPFTYGNILRLMGNKNLYLKNIEVIERMQQINHIIFDKTGTLTDHKKLKLEWSGSILTGDEKRLIKSATFQSTHPLSKAIFSLYDGHYEQEILDFKEIVGQGTIAKINGYEIKIGSADFIFGTESYDFEKGVFIEINGVLKGHFLISNSFRDGVKELIQTLSRQFPVSILSGDNDQEKEKLKALFPEISNMHFNQKPADKLLHIKNLQKNGYKVMMIGDGLNDAGALKQSEVGIVISDHSNNFTPACDAILNAEKFKNLLSFITFLRKSRVLIMGAFVLALIYNCIGLYFAVQGLLSPVIAAILMPVSSISVMLFGVLSSKWLFTKYVKI